MSEDYEKYFVCKKPGKKSKSRKPKPVGIKSTGIRASAKGKQCTLRIPGICRGEEACLCHAGISAMGAKSLDGHAYYGCGLCHAFEERRYAEPQFSKEWNRHKIRSYVLDAMIETQIIMHELGDIP